MKKKILIFSLFYYPNPVSGAEVAVKEITDRCSIDDYEFHLITLRGTIGLENHEQLGNVLVHRILGGANINPKLEDFAKKPFAYYKYIYQIYAGLYTVYLHLKYNFDSIWVLMAHSSGVPAGIFSYIFPKVKIILTLQEGDPIEKIEKSVKPLWPFFIRVFKKANVVQAISGYLGDWAKSLGATCPIEIIYNGANENDFKESLDIDVIEKVKKEINRKNGEVIIVTTSRLVEKNAIDDAIAAMQYLPENIRFIICGAGEDLVKLQNLTRTLNLENRVKFMGQVDRNETSAYRRLSDIFVRPSRSEGLGNSFVGAMASRLPVIATQEGGIAEFLFDEFRNPDKQTTGFAVDKNNPKQIAEKIKYIIANPEKVRIVTENAYRLVVNDYRWENIAHSMQDKVFNKI